MSKPLLTFCLVVLLPSCVASHDSVQMTRSCKIRLEEGFEFAGKEGASTHYRYTADGSAVLVQVGALSGREPAMDDSRTTKLAERKMGELTHSKYERAAIGTIPRSYVHVLRGETARIIVSTTVIDSPAIDAMAAQCARQKRS